MTLLTRDPDTSSDSDPMEVSEDEGTDVPTQDDLDFIVADDEVEESDYDDEEDSYDPEDDDDDDPDYEPVDDVDESALEEYSKRQLAQLYLDTRDELESTRTELVQTVAYWKGMVRELQQQLARRM